MSLADPLLPQLGCDLNNLTLFFFSRVSLAMALILGLWIDLAVCWLEHQYCLDIKIREQNEVKLDNSSL